MGGRGATVASRWPYVESLSKPEALPDCRSDPDCHLPAPIEGHLTRPGGLSPRGFSRLLPAILCLGLPWPVPAASQEAAGTPPTDEARTRLSAADLLAELGRDSGTRFRLRHALVAGSLDASSAGLDTVRRPLDLEDVRFTGEAFLPRVVFLAPVRVQGSAFEGGLSLQGARFHGPAAFGATRVERQANLKGAAFLAGADFTDGGFLGVGSFIDTRFEGESIFQRVRFRSGAYFEGARFGAPADFRSAVFGDVASFKETEWSDVSFAGARFWGRILFWEAVFAGTARFDKARAERQVSFDHARFDGPASFADFIFADPAVFSGIRAREDIVFAGAYFRKDADFRGGTFSGELNLAGRIQKGLDLRRIRSSTVTLLATDPAQVTFGDSAILYLQEARWDELRFRWSELRGRLAAADPGSLDDLEPVYADLGAQLRRQGRFRDAEACLVEWMDLRRRHLGWTDPARWGLELFGRSTRYGTDPGRFAGAAVSAVLLFGLLYRLGRGGLAPVSGSARASLVDCILFSLQAFVRGCHPDWRPTGVLRFLANLQVLLGWIGLALLVVTLLSPLR